LGFEVADRGPLGGPGSPEVVFLSQSETDHHQLAFAPVRRGDEPSNSVNHMAFRTGELADVRAMAEALAKDGRATEINPMTHGNAWSVYFKDPEHNGVEVFCDTPWHVQQPQARPLDLSKSDEEIHAWTQAEFENEPEFGPIDAYYAKRAEKLAMR
jgi:catechol 2,3-dioxygenase